jgi:hypothetical protein
VKRKRQSAKTSSQTQKVLHHNLTKTSENKIEHLTIKDIELSWQINATQIIVEHKTWDEIDKDNDTEPPHNEEKLIPHDKTIIYDQDIEEDQHGQHG